MCVHFLKDRPKQRMKIVAPHRQAVCCLLIADCCLQSWSLLNSLFFPTSITYFCVPFKKNEKNRDTFYDHSHRFNRGIGCYCVSAFLVSAKIVSKERKQDGTESIWRIRWPGLFFSSYLYSAIVGSCRVESKRIFLIRNNFRTDEIRIIRFWHFTSIESVLPHIVWIGDIAQRTIRFSAHSLIYLRQHILSFQFFQFF